MINFKKVTSMVVMLSLMLGACGKSPARRDSGIATDTDTIADLVALEKENEKLVKQDGAGYRIFPIVAGAVGGIGVGAVVGTLGTAAVLLLAKFSLLSWLGFDLPVKAMAGYSLIVGPLAGALAGGIVGGISGAAGDGWKKVMLLNTIIAGSVIGIVAGVTATAIGAYEVYKAVRKARRYRNKWKGEEKKWENEELDVEMRADALAEHLAEDENLRLRCEAAVEVQKLNNLWLFIFKNKWEELVVAEVATDRDMVSALRQLEQQATLERQNKIATLQKNAKEAREQANMNRKKGAKQGREVGEGVKEYQLSAQRLEEQAEYYEAEVKRLQAQQSAKEEARQRAEEKARLAAEEKARLAEEEKARLAEEEKARLARRSSRRTK